jgi:hypothetical protein
MNEERKRLAANATKKIPLEKWGPYLSERQWGTVREDYSANSDAWNYFTHEQARSRAYRWGEDGIGGISDIRQNLCFAIALWNGKDEIIKERLFGLTNNEGNHGEDVKELYYYLDNTPTHSYMQYLYKYPQSAFPYKKLLEVNYKLSREEPEYELLETGIFDENEYFDVQITYAKNNEEDICIEIAITNRANEAAALTVLPTLWFRNSWQFGDTKEKPGITVYTNVPHESYAIANHERLGNYYFYYQHTHEVLMTENETNTEKIFNTPNKTPFVKDAFHDAIVGNNKSLKQKLTTNNTGTKIAPVYQLSIAAKKTQKIMVRLCKEAQTNPFNTQFENAFHERKMEADAFYNDILPSGVTDDVRNIQRQAFAGLLWSKQFYKYDIEKWLEADINHSASPHQRKTGRNATWENLKIADVLAMPDKWEYPWFAAWDLCFHCIPMAMVDPVFAKNQLILLCREWYMSPQGQIPAYEWNFSDINPPVQAWAVQQVYKIEKEFFGTADINFLKRMFKKLMINFTWWANREDENANNIFKGGFLGLDNIGVIDRSNLIPGTKLEQVDGTAWMGNFALNMMEIALEITKHDPSYEDMVTKFYEHFVLIASSLNEILWDDADSFFYDSLHTSKGNIPMKVRSIVGLTVLYDVAVIKQEDLQRLPDFKKRMEFLKQYYKAKNLFLPHEQLVEGGDILVSLVHKDRLTKILEKMVDETEFLSSGGIRGLSKFHEKHPFHLHVNHTEYSINYQPAESNNNMFGGNSNWRGPVWLPVNYLLIDTLYQYHDFYGDTIANGELLFNKYHNLKEIANELSNRIISIFTLDEQGTRPALQKDAWFYNRPENKALILFYEYFNGDNAAGLGAAHQTGWSSLVINLIKKVYSA